MKNSSDTGVNHHFSGKTVQRWGTINEKQKKEAFVGVRLIKTQKTSLRNPYDERKTRKITLRKCTMNRETAKNGFPVRGKTKNQRKILSQNWEDEKMWKIGFPNIGKNKKSQRLYFPTLGRTKNIVGSFPNPLDERFFLFFIHLTPWTNDFSRFHSSEALDEHFNAWLSTNPFAVWCSKQSSFLSGH